MAATAQRQAHEAALRRGRGAVRRLRNAVQEALPVLAQLERAAETADTIGRLVVDAGEPVDMGQVGEFLDLARAETGQELEIIVLAKGTDDRPTGHTTQESRHHVEGA